MKTSSQGERVRMMRPNLKDLPQWELPKGFRSSWYCPGDEAHWMTIQGQAEQYHSITREVFSREFENNAEELSRRQCFLWEGNEPVGTATAWFEKTALGIALGRIHWVAIRPQWQGRGLSKPLMSITLLRLLALGHDRAVLGTAASRVAAISLYQKCGFLPQIHDPKEEKVWRKIESQIATFPR